MGSSLPPSSFATVITNRLLTPRVAWIASDGFSEQMARDNAYCIRQNYETAEIYDTAEKIQRTDRYGGDRIGCAGGSGRCATFAEVQIKGIGATPLVSHKTDQFHASGTASLQEAGREVIWSQIFSVILPHGAVSHLAIVLTGGVFPERNPQGIDIPRQRTLIMREFALRPAHYLRNLFYKPPNAGTNGLSYDSHRVQSAINSLHLGFDEVFGKQAKGMTDIARINLGLREMAKRIAAQMAASFAKRIFHGAISGSNIALDGRFLDFGVTTFVARYRRRSWAGGWLDQWAQRYSPQGILHHLRFLTQKYFRSDDIKSLIPESELMKEFQAASASRLEIEMLKMIGLSEDIVLLYPTEKRARLLRSLRQIYSRGASEIFTTWPAHADTAGFNPPPSRDGRYDLNVILALASTCSDRDDLDRTLADALNDVNLRRQFAENYSDFREWFVSRFEPEARKAAKLYLALQAVRLNADLSFLKREVLDEKLTVFDANPEGVGVFIDETVRRATYFLQQHHSDLVGSDARSQVDSLARMGGGLHEFVMVRASAEWVSPQACAGIERMLDLAC